MPRFQIRAGDQVFTCSLRATTEAAALDELAAEWERSFQSGNDSYAVPDSEPATSIDMTPGQLFTAEQLDS